MTRYEITFAGEAGPVVGNAVEGFELDTVGGGRSTLVGDVVDQAALHGALHRLQDLHLEILEVHRLDT